MTRCLFIITLVTCYKVQLKGERCWRTVSATWLCRCCAICRCWWRHLGIPTWWSRSPGPRERLPSPAASPLRESRTAGAGWGMRGMSYTLLFTQPAQGFCDLLPLSSHISGVGHGGPVADLTLVLLQIDCPLLWRSWECSKGCHQATGRLGKELACFCFRRHQWV